MSKTIEQYIEKLKCRVKWLQKCQADYREENFDERNQPAQYYVNSTEIITLEVVIRDLTKFTIHEYSYWNQ